MNLAPDQTIPLGQYYPHNTDGDMEAQASGIVSAGARSRPQDFPVHCSDTSAGRLNRLKLKVETLKTPQAAFR